MLDKTNTYTISESWDKRSFKITKRNHDEKWITNACSIYNFMYVIVHECLKIFMFKENIQSTSNWILTVSLSGFIPSLIS